MGKLLRFILETIHIIVFLFLIGICMYLMYKTSGYRQWVFRSVGTDVTAPVLYFQQAQVDRLHLKQVAASLKEHNQELLTKIYNYPLHSSQESLLPDTMLFSYIHATVIHNSLFKQKNYFIIDKGSLYGIEPKMGVISSHGVVGVVKEVSPHFSIVLSLLHSDFKLSVQIGQEQLSGVLAWRRQNHLLAQVENLTTIEGVKIQDTVFTSKSLLFPENYPVGTIYLLQDKNIGGYSSLPVKLLAKFDKLHTVYVVKRNFIDEINQLLAVQEEKEEDL